VAEIASNPGGHSAQPTRRRPAGSSRLAPSSLPRYKPHASGRAGEDKRSIPSDLGGLRRRPQSDLRSDTSLTLTETVTGGKVIATTEARTNRKKVQKKVVPHGTMTIT
jgi:hypothetical protein